MRLMEWLFGEDERLVQAEAEVAKLVREKAQLLRSLDMAWSLIRCLRDCNADLDAKQYRRPGS